MAGAPLSVRCPSYAARVWGEVVRRLATTALACAWVLAASGCGSAASARTASPQSGTAPTGAAVAGGACADVRTTTPIEQVTLACQALWSPYGVTQVPPTDVLRLERVPNTPTVVNMTGGAVPDSTAQHWADASNWDSGWWRWAQANDQLLLLHDLVGPALIPAAEVEAMRSGGNVAQPDCNLYPISWKLFAVGAAGRAYFARKRLPTDDTYLFVVVYSGPCAETVTHGDGGTTTIVDFTQDTTVFSPGVLRHDPLLGDIWFANAGGSCQDPAGPPPAWCGR
jgi:hypothetical protein